MNTKLTLALGFAAGVGLMTCLAAAQSEPEVTPTPTPTLEVQEYTAPDDLVTEDIERPTYTVETLPPCEQEDSDNCYWDASTMGNGEGRSFYTIEGETTYTDPEPLPPIKDEGDWYPMDTGVLICGPDAKPAIDYNQYTGYGWWAYCEPALAD